MNKTRWVSSNRDGSAEGDAAIIEVRLARALIAMNSHLLEAAAQTNAPATITEEQLRAVMKNLTQSVSSPPSPVVNRYVWFQFLAPRQSRDVSDDESHDLRRCLRMAAERRNGVIRRLMVHPIRKFELVTGKIYGLMLLGAVQILFFLAVGKFAMGVTLGCEPAVTLTLLVLGWVGGSTGCSSARCSPPPIASRESVCW